jgi:hypothetical protein
MAILVPGRNQRSTATRSLWRSETQPAVGPPVCWCRRMPLPFVHTGRRSLKSITAACW